MQTGQSVINAYLFQAGELEALLSSMKSITVNDLCPLSMDNADKPLPQELQKLSGQTAFLSAASVLAQPHLRLSAQKGGGSLGLEKFYLLARKTHTDAQWVVLMNDGKAAGVLCLSSTRDTARWFAETLGSECQSKARDLLGGSMGLKTWLTAAHAIDTFRRLYMESMLVYNPTYSFRVAREDFQATWQASAESGDVRWLLPAFLALTPGVSGWIGGMGLDGAESLEQCGLIRPGQMPGTDKECLELTSDGMAAGFEFTSSWMYGVGWEASTLEAPSVQTAFLAPTSLANHLFWVDRNEEQEPVLTHLPLTLKELEESLERSFSGLLTRIPAPAEPAQEKQPPSAPAEPAQEKHPQPAPAFKFCMKCGQKLSNDAKFCAKCGSKAESKG